MYGVISLKHRNDRDARGWRAEHGETTISSKYGVISLEHRKYRDARGRRAEHARFARYEIFENTIFRCIKTLDAISKVTDNRTDISIRTSMLSIPISKN